MKVFDEPEELCWTSLVEVVREQRQRLDTLEAAMREAIREMDLNPTSTWTPFVSRTLLNAALTGLETKEN